MIRRATIRVGGPARDDTLPDTIPADIVDMLNIVADLSDALKHTDTDEVAAALTSADGMTRKRLALLRATARKLADIGNGAQFLMRPIDEEIVANGTVAERAKSLSRATATMQTALSKAPAAALGAYLRTTEGKPLRAKIDSIRERLDAVR